MNVRFEISLKGAFALGIVALGLFSCNRENAPDCFQTAGAQEAQHRALSPFTTIELNDYVQYEFYDTNYYGVEITAPGNLITDVRTEVSDGKLVIQNLNTCNFVRSYKNRIAVRIYAPEFRDVQNYSTGDIATGNTIIDEFFSLENRGSAGVQRLKLNCDTVNIASHTGVSDTYLSGECDVVQLFSQGLGLLDARDLTSNYAFVNNSSLNDVYVKAHSYLYGFIQFSGNIYYDGNPQTIDKDIEGEGRIVEF